MRDPTPVNHPNATSLLIKPAPAPYPFVIAGVALPSLSPRQTHKTIRSQLMISCACPHSRPFLMKTARTLPVLLLTLGLVHSGFSQGRAPGSREPAPSASAPAQAAPAAAKPTASQLEFRAQMAQVRGELAEAEALLAQAVALAEREGNPTQLRQLRSKRSQMQRKIASSRFDFGRTTPWTADDVIAALERRVDFMDLAKAIHPNHVLNRLGANAGKEITPSATAPGAAIDLPGYRRILTSPAGQRFHEESYFSETLHTTLIEITRPRSEAIDAHAREVVARRRAQVTVAAAPVDSPDLRARYAAGDPAAAYQLYHVVARKSSTLHRWPEDEPTRAELIAKATANGYAPAQWLRASDLIHGTEKDLAQAAVLARISAEAGDPYGAFELAKLFSAPDGLSALARNHAAAEYWFIEAGARDWRAPDQQTTHRADLELANLYSGLSPNGTMATSLPNSDDATYRWARHLLARGGLLAENGRLLLEYLRHHTYNDGRKVDVEARLAAVPPEVPEFSPEKQRSLGLATADPSALLTLADALATGRGLPQDDVRAVQYYRQAADAGAGFPAYRALARHYAQGHGVNASRTGHFAWLTRAAETGEAEAWAEIASLHFNYTGADKQDFKADHAASAAARERAIALGHTPSLFWLGLLHRNGQGVPKDEARARELILQAAEKNYLPALTEVASAHEKGPPVDFEAAVRWYRRAVEAGDRTARLPLAKNLSSTGKTAEAIALYEEIARDGALPVNIQYDLAQLIENQGDLKRALEWYRKTALSENTLMERWIKWAAEAWNEIEAGLEAAPGTLAHQALLARNPNDGEAKFRYAVMLAPTNPEEARIQIGRAAVFLQHPGATTVLYNEMARTDKAGALAWARQRADEDNSQAVLILALEQGATHPAAAIAGIRRAAGLGNLDAKFRYGMMQFQGQGVPPDRAAGLALVADAADGGQPEAMILLGTSLIRGEAGVPADPDRGVAYLRRAAAQTDHPPVAQQAAEFLRQYEQHHAQQSFETIWADPETRFQKLAALYAGAKSDGHRAVVDFLAGKIAPDWEQSNLQNKYQPVRDIISRKYKVINTLEGEENRQARFLLYFAMNTLNTRSMQAGRPSVDFFYKWIRPD